MDDPELCARAGYAAVRLEQAWQRWRTFHRLGGPADPLASYVGYSLAEPMGQPRVVIGFDAAEAIFFADFLDSQGAARSLPHEPASAGDRLDARPGVLPQPDMARLDAAEAEHPVIPGPADRPRDTRAFAEIPPHGTWPPAPDQVGAEIARWNLGGKPGYSYR
jgi:hypothetical protein